MKIGGKMMELLGCHKLTPVRMLFIRQALSNFLERDTELPKTFAGLRILDVGCGGGLLMEPLKGLVLT